MRYFHSQKNFEQYRPHKGFLEKIKDKQKKKDLDPNISLKEFKNPFIQREKEPSKIKRNLVIFVIFALFLSWIGLIIYLPYFSINQINVKGTNIISTEDIKLFAKYNSGLNDNFCFFKNYFVFNEKKLSKKIKNQYNLDAVQITKVFPNTIDIQITEKKPVIIIDDGKKYTLVNDNVESIKILETLPTAQPIVETVTTTNTSTVLSIANPKTEEYKKLSAEYNFTILKNTADLKKESLQTIIHAVINWQNQLKQQGIGEMRYAEVNNTGLGVKIFLDKPWYVLVDQSKDSLVQINNIKIILKNNKPIEYIDTRFGEKVYWK